MGEPVGKPLRLSLVGLVALLLGIVSLDGPWVWAATADETDAQSAGRSLLVELQDVDGKPVSKTRIRVFDGNSYWAGRQQRYKMQIAKTNSEGLATFDDFFNIIPDRAGYWIQVFREKGESWRAPGRLSGRGLSLSKSDSGNPLVQSTVNEDGLRIVITLREECSTDIKIIDATTGKRRHFAQLLFKDERVDDWTLAALQDYVGDPGGDDPSRLGLDFFTTMIPEMSDTLFMATREGYYPVEFRLKEKLRVDKKLQQVVELKRAPLIELTVLGVDGNPTKDAKLKYSGPDMRGSYGPTRPTDKNGRTFFLYPELGRLARYDIVHQDGIGDFSMADLPQEPELHWLAGKPPKLGISDPSIKTDGNRWAVIRHTVQLKPAPKTN